MAHKPECPRSKDANAACTMNCETPAPTTRKCWDCETDIGVSEKKCPKCGAELETADAEDEVVGRALTRMKKKNAAKKKAATPPTPPAEQKKASPLLGLGKLVK